MTKRKLEAYRRLYDRLEAYGFDSDEIDALLRIERTLHRWAEHECNGNIQRDETTGKPRWWSTDPGCFMSGNGWPIADRERGALKRLHTIMARHPGVLYYHQGDPRGCALYIIDNRTRGITSGVWDTWIDGNYSSAGVAVCV